MANIMSFLEFLAYIREHVGKKCNDAYWQRQYNRLPNKSHEYIQKETPFMAVHAVGEDSRHRRRKKP